MGGCYTLPLTYALYPTHSVFSYCFLAPWAIRRYSGRSRLLRQESLPEWPSAIGFLRVGTHGNVASLLGLTTLATPRVRKLTLGYANVVRPAGFCVWARTLMWLTAG